MKSLCTALGLSADASEEAALAELNKLKNRVTTADAAIEPGKTRVKELEVENTQLKNRNTELLTAVVEQDLAKYANRFKPEAKESWKKNLLLNRAFAIELLESLPEPKADNQADQTTQKSVPMHNRAQAKTPAATPGDSGKDKEAARAKAIANRAQTIMRKDGKHSAAAWREATAEVDGFEHGIDSYAVRHIFAEHGNPATEAARGQIAITKSDLSAVPAIIAAADSIDPGGQSRLGRDTIVYKKKMGGTTYVIEEVRTGRRRLALVSMRKMKNRATSSAADTALSHTSGTLRADTSS